MVRLLSWCIAIYQRSPVKPFRGILGKLYAKYQLLNRNKVIIATRDGLKYKLDLSEYIDRSIYYQGCFEPDTAAVINKYCKSGMIVLDVGANMGVHTLRMANLVGKHGKVIAFEPMAYAFAKLETNIRLNSFSNVILEKCALSEVSVKNESAYFRSSWKDGENSTNSEILEQIEFVTLDDYVGKNDVDRIDFIKLDVDGCEYKVIRGVDTIKKFKPTMIVELGNFGDSLEDLVRLIASLGYSFYSPEDLREYSKESLLAVVPPDSTINVLCKPNVGYRKLLDRN